MNANPASDTNMRNRVTPRPRPKSASFRQLSKASSNRNGSYGEEAEVTLSDNSLSEEDQSSHFQSGNVPKLSLPILYEDEENPVTVTISCRKCLDIEKVLMTFTQMHVKAFVACREKGDSFWELITVWNGKLQKNLEQLKSHLLGEFILHIDQAPLSEFKDDHDFRVQCSSYRLLYNHLRSMENRLSHRHQELACPIRESYNAHQTDKVLKDIQVKISATQCTLQQLEQRIRTIAKSWDSARAETNPHGFRQAIFTKEDYIFNRLSNIFICIDFLEDERAFYEMKARELASPTKRFIPLMQLKPRSEQDQIVKSSNVQRRPQNSVKRKLPSAIAHFYPFAKPQYMRDIHASWFRTLLRSDDIRKEISQQRSSNTKILLDIQQLKEEIYQLETQLKLKEYANASLNSDSYDGAMFPPDKATTKAPGFLDFNKFF